VSKSLKKLQTVSSLGLDPCHLSLSHDKKYIYTANYSSGTVSGYKLLENGRIDESTKGFSF